MRIGSLCTGIAGLELGLQYAGVAAKPVFVADIDPGACDWLADAMPYTTNLHDFTQLDALPECDILTAGFPCQPFSSAGKRAGLSDERYLFDDIARLVGNMDTRPILFLENVPTLLTSVSNGEHAMARVVHRLAAIGYSITWGCLSAAAVGAPHRRVRWWGLAYPSDTEGTEWRGPQQQHLRETARPAAESGERARALADRFGPYAAAISRWERVLGRTAPDPVTDGKLSEHFVEFMMGFPKGWVTDVLPSKNQSLRALGNAVVPQAAAQAFIQLTRRVAVT